MWTRSQIWKIFSQNDTGPHTYESSAQPPPLYCRTKQDVPDTVSQASKLDPILGKKGNRYASAQRTGINIETHGSKD